MSLTGYTKAWFLGLTLVILSCGFLFFREVDGHAPISPLEVLTYNIGGIPGPLNKFEEIVSIVESRGVPDVIFLQEVRGMEQTAAFGRRLKIRHYDYVNYRNIKNAGIAILSKYELTGRDVLYYGSDSSHYGSLAVQTVIDGRKVLLCSVHFESIGDTLKDFKTKDRIIELSWLKILGLAKKELFGGTGRYRSAGELLTWLAGYETDNAIIGGDFNTFPFSRAIRRVESKFDDALWPSLDFFSSSYDRIAFPIKPRIDFIFHSPDIKCTEATVIKMSPGDHYPVWAMFDLRG